MKNAAFQEDLVMVQFGKRFVSGHRFSDAAKDDNSERL
jgi:hypothetical protein